MSLAFHYLSNSCLLDISGVLLLSSDPTRVDSSTGPGHAGGLLSDPVSGVGVLPLPKGDGLEQEAQRGPSGHSRVRGPAEQAGTLRGRHHPVHRRPPPAGRVQTRAEGPR